MTSLVPGELRRGIYPNFYHEEHSAVPSALRFNAGEKNHSSGNRSHRGAYSRYVCAYNTCHYRFYLVRRWACSVRRHIYTHTELASMLHFFCSFVHQSVIMCGEPQQTTMLGFFASTATLTGRIVAGRTRLLDVAFYLLHTSFHSSSFSFPESLHKRQMETAAFLAKLQPALHPPPNVGN